MENGLATRGHVTQTTLNTIRKMNTKLKGLMFLSSDVQALSTYIDETLAVLPASGVVNGTQYSNIVTLVSGLSDEDSIRRLIKNLNIANGSPEQDDVAVPAAVQPAETVTTQPAEATEPKVQQENELVSQQIQAEEEIEQAGMADSFNPFDLVGSEDAASTEQAEDEDVLPEPQPLVVPPVSVSSVVSHGVFSF